MPMSVPLRRAAVGAVIVALLGAVGASAAALGGVSSTRMYSSNLPGGTPAPTILAADHFTGTGSLAGRTAPVGGIWTVHAGTWTLAGNLLDPPNTTSARATLDAGVTDGTARALITLTGAHEVGLALRASATGANFVAATHRNNAGGQLRILRVVGGAATVIATLDGVGSTTPSTLSASISGNNVTVTWGASTLNYTLTFIDNALLGTPGTRFGVYGTGADDETIDDFRVESP